MRVEATSQQSRRSKENSLIRGQPASLIYLRLPLTPIMLRNIRVVLVLDTSNCWSLRIQQVVAHQIGSRWDEEGMASGLKTDFPIRGTDGVQVPAYSRETGPTNMSDVLPVRPDVLVAGENLRGWSK